MQAQDQASRVIGDVFGLLGKLPGPLGLLAVGAGAVAGAIVGIGSVSTVMAADFQTAMLSLVAHAGLAKSQFDSVSAAVLAMAPAVGRAPTELADALYPILSAFSGITNQSAKAAISLDTLKMSFETVAGTTVDGTAVAKAAVGTFNALGLATNNVSTNTQRMKQLFDVMDKTVQLGNTNWNDYKGAVTKVALAIQGTNVKFNESQAALAVMTNSGFPSAQKASTYLVNTLNTLEIKTNALAAHAKKLGINFDQAKYGPMSLADKIEYLNKITDGNKQKLLALMGNNSTALRTFNALSGGIDAYRSNLDTLNHSQGALASSFDTAAQGFKFHLSQMAAAGQALLITIGTPLLGALTNLVSLITPLIVVFTRWISSGQAANTAMTIFHTIMSRVIAVVAGVTPFFQAVWRVLQDIGSFLAATFKPVWDQLVQTWQQLLPELRQLWAALVPLKPLLQLLGMIVGTVVVVALALLVGILGGLIRAFANVLSAVVQVIGGIVKIISGGVQVTAGIIRFFIDLLTGHFSKLGDDLKGIWHGIVMMFAGSWEAISGIFKAAWGAISGFVSGLVQGVIGFFQHLANVLVGHSIVPDMINTMVQFFASLPGRALSAVSSLLGRLAGFFGNLASQAVGWGLNIIKNLAGGIISGISSALGGAFSAIGTFIHDHLPHSPAKRGPLRDLARQGSLIPVQIAEGMLRGQGALQIALNKTFTLSAPVTTAGSHSLTPAGGQVINIGPVYVNTGNASNPNQMADQFIQAVSRKLRQSGNLITWTSGGRA